MKAPSEPSHGRKPVPETAPEADLWFLPGPPEEQDDAPTLLSLPRADRRDLAVASEWRAAQSALSVELARTAALFGALDERLRQVGEGGRQRLALMEAAELSWHSGDRIAPDRLALWVGLRLAGAQEDALALARAAWAVRRLSGGPGPEAGAADGLASFLGRQDTSGSGDLIGRLQDWRDALATGEGLHPFVRAAWGLRLWELAGISGQGAAAMIEAQVTAARLAAAAGRGGALFLPVLLGGPLTLRRDGPPEVQLARWLAGAEQAVLAALLHLDRLAAWRNRAETALASLTGRTPPRLVSALAGWPMASAPMAEALTGSSRAAVQRNLDIMADAGLIREVTGQGRYRMWAAKL